MTKFGSETRKSPLKFMRFRITEDQHEELKQDANKYGCDLSSLMRIRVMGKRDDLKIVMRPPVEMRILGDALGQLGQTTSDLNKIGFNLEQIAKRLSQGERDLFLLDSSLRQFERNCSCLTDIYALIEKSIAGCHQRKTEPR